MKQRQQLNCSHHRCSRSVLKIDPRVAPPRAVGQYLVLCSVLISVVDCFTLQMMAGRRSSRKGGGIKKALDELENGPSNAVNRKVKSLNGGKGQEITGVSLPKEGEMKGWQFGEDKTITCTKFSGNYYALSGTCPRCAFDLFRGKNLVDDPGWPDPSVACTTCYTTYNWMNGQAGATMKKKGFAGFVGGLAASATVGATGKNVDSFVITVDDDDRIFCKERAPLE